MIGILIIIGLAALGGIALTGRSSRTSGGTIGPSRRGAGSSSSSSVTGGSSPAPTMLATPGTLSPTFDRNMSVISFRPAGDLAGGFLSDARYSGWSDLNHKIPCRGSGIVTHPGDVEFQIIDTSPEVGRSGHNMYGQSTRFSSAGYSESTPDYYSVVFTAGGRIPDEEHALYLANYDVDKREGGQDYASWQEPDGRWRYRHRDRGDKWPASWKSAVMYMRPRFLTDVNVRTNPFLQLQSLAEQITGGSYPVACCRCRNDRTPARYMCELLRIAKMHKRFTDTFSAHMDDILGIFETVANMMTAGVGGSVIAQAVLQEVVNTGIAMARAAAYGNLTSWQQLGRVLWNEVRDIDTLQSLVAIGYDRMNGSQIARVRSMVHVSGADIVTEYAAQAMIATMDAPLEYAQASIANAKSPGNIARVVIYE